MRRFGTVTRVLPEKKDEYVRLHADTWPGVLARITACNIINYSIYLTPLPDGEHYLFSYFEYTGDDFENDMKDMAADPVVQQWWNVCKPCLAPTVEMPPGEVWVPMEEVFHHD